MSKIIGVDGHILETEEAKEKRLAELQRQRDSNTHQILRECAGLLMGVARVPAKLARNGMSLDQYKNWIAQAAIKIIGAEEFEARFKAKLLLEDEPLGTEKSNDASAEELPPLPGVAKVVTGMFPKSKRVH